MTAQELRKKFLDFFKSKGHTIIPSASLIPKETDPSVLFTTAGMHPLIPYLLGDDHPGGDKVVNIQKCVRTVDIDEVGDNRHLTFFEMMGNWSFGDYFKKEAIEWSFEFLTGKKWLGLNPKRIYPTVFKGDGDIPRDKETIKIWEDVFNKAGIKTDVAQEDTVVKSNTHIIPLGTEDNFWIASSTGPCGPDTEMFYDTRPGEGGLNDTFENLVNSGRLIEIWNNVFIEFNKTADGEYKKLSQQNVDTGMGLERTLAVINEKETVFETELLQPIFKKIEELSGTKYQEQTTSYQIIGDHIKAATFIIADGIAPSNTDQGYVLRRLIRRAVRYGKTLGIENNFTKQIAEVVIEMYKIHYPELEEVKNVISDELEAEENRFREVIADGLKKMKKLTDTKDSISSEVYSKIMQVQDKKEIFRKIYKEKDSAGEINKFGITTPEVLKATVTGHEAFDLYQTYGFPIEMIVELAQEQKLFVDIEDFDKESKKHQDLSRTASVGKFKGGLADAGEETAELHTATHLLLAALREVLNEEIYQKGSNITAERLRFDFNYPEKLTDEQKKQVENLVNEKIKENIPVEMEEMSKDEALKITKVSFDSSKYGDVVKVYKIGNFSTEACGGPHAKSTGELGHFKIKKEESSSAGVRRIKAILG